MGEERAAAIMNVDDINGKVLEEIRLHIMPIVPYGGTNEAIIVGQSMLAWAVGFLSGILSEDDIKDMVSDVLTKV